MNFCKVYNKIMNRLDEIIPDDSNVKRTNVSEINIFEGIIYLIVRIVATFFGVIIILLPLYIFTWVYYHTLSKCELKDLEKEKKS